MGADRPRLTAHNGCPKIAACARECAGSDTQMPQQFRRFADFYPHYLAEHSNRTCRRLHFVGTSGALALLAAAAATQNVWLVPVAIVCGYGFAWVGHFAFEKNRPATFTHPIYSLIGDWVMWAEIATGRIRF